MNWDMISEIDVRRQSSPEVYSDIYKVSQKTLKNQLDIALSNVALLGTALTHRTWEIVKFSWFLKRIVQQTCYCPYVNCNNFI